MNVLFLPKSPNSANNFKAGQNKSVNQNNPGLKLSFRSSLGKIGDSFSKSLKEQSLENFSQDCLWIFNRFGTKDKECAFKRMIGSLIEHYPHTVNILRKCFGTKSETTFDWENEHEVPELDLTRHTAEDLRLPFRSYSF